MFTNLDLLKMWSQNSPATVFPERKIGRLADGFEASFLVLSGNPLKNFDHVKSIVLRFKEGVDLSDVLREAVD